MAERPARRTIARVRSEQLTFLGADALLDLHQRTRDLERRGRDGVIVEAGCARGGSALVVAGAKAPSRAMYVYDVFGMIPPPTDEDGSDVHERYEVIVKGDAGPGYYGYESNLREQVHDAFDRYGLPPEEHNVHLVEGRYEDTLRLDDPVVLAHIDCDWYASVMTCLIRLEPLLVPGGVMVIDDYNVWSGARRAVDEYFADKGARFRFRHGARLQIERRTTGDRS